MRKGLTLLLAVLLIQAPGGAQADTDDLFALSLRPNVLILMDGSSSMNNTDGGKYNVQYGVDLNGNGNVSCPGSECVSDLDIDGRDNTRNDVALNVVLDLLDANKDGVVDVRDENALGMRLGLVYWTSAGINAASRPCCRADGRPRAETEYDFPVVAPVGTPYADIKKAIIDPIVAGTPDIRIVVGQPRGCSANGSEDTSPCNAVNPAVGFALTDTPLGEVLEYVEHYFLPEQVFSDPEGVCRQNFVILITDGSSNGFSLPPNIAASLYNNGTPKVHGLGVPDGFLDRYGKLIPVPGTSFTYQFTDKDSNLLTREFTKKFTAGVTFVDVKLASTVPGATAPASCLTDCFAYDPNGGDATSIPPTDLGYVGGLDSAIYGSGTALTSLTLVSGNILDPEPPYYAKTFAVGFSGGNPSELDATAAAGGTGTAFFPGTYTELTSNLKSAITQIQAETLSIAAPAIPAARAVSGNMIFLASFTPSGDPFWYGELTAYPLQSDGTIQVNGLGEITATPIWEAHTVLNGTADNARNIKTVLSGTNVVDFKGPNIALNTALNVTLDLDGNGTLNSADALWLIDYVKGVNGTNPAWKLGDIYHSSPVVIGPPSSVYLDLNLDRTLDTSFPLFRDAFKTRDRVIYTGSNAGMLHAFHAGSWQGTDYDAGTGAERWGFIPPDLLPKLQDMVSTHTYYVDGPPKAADVWLDANSDGVKAANEWHTVLVTGERRGGNVYFALDITDPGTAASPNDPTYLWSFTDTNLGESWSRAAIGKVRLSLDNGATTIERWVAFVGGGYLPSSDTSSIGKAFFVIDINTGTKLWEYTVVNDASMDRTPAPPTAVDTNGDSFVDRVYVGDLSGNIWRFDLQAVGTTSGLGTLVSGWTGSQLFTASSGRPFYNQVALAADPVGQLWVYGGTGELDDLLNTSSLDRFYAIKEAYPRATGTPPGSVPAVVTDGDLADTTGVNTLNVNDPVFAGKGGWFLTLSPGEKVLSDPEVFAEVLLFTSFIPTQATCTQKGGNTTLYTLSYLTGGGASDYAAFKVGTEGLSKTLATIAGLSSGPKISLPGRTSTGASSGGDVVLFVCTSGEVCGNPPPPQPGSLRRIDYWRDL